MKILNFGSMNLDYVYSLNHIVVPGETIASNGMEVHLGGKGMNQSIALAKAGAPVYHAGCIGEDGKLFMDACDKYGVHSRHIKTVAEKTGHTIIQVDKEGQNCIILYGGANQSIPESYVVRVLDDFQEGDMLLLQNEVNGVDKMINLAYEKGMIIALNPSPFNDKLLQCDFQKVSYFLLNEIEGYQITGEKEADKILSYLKSHYPKAKVVLTLGGDGAIYQDQTEQIKQGIFPTKVVDTTAAGDTFTGFFLAAVVEGKTKKEALLLAAKASSLAVSRKGAVDSIPLRDEIQEN